MHSGPNLLLKPLIGMVALGYITLLIIAIFMGNLSFSKALFQDSIVILLYLVWYYAFSNFEASSSRPIIRLKGTYYRFCSSFFCVLLGIPYFFLMDPDHRYEKAVYLVVLSIICFLFAISLYKRIRLIENTAPTFLSSAAQGYTELKGKVRLYDHEVARGPHLDLPIMVWYDSGLKSSTAGFILEDQKGRCTIDPQDAEVITPRYSYNGHSYNAIYPDETIYVLGYLETLNKHRTEHEKNSLIGKKISNWKQQQFHFLELFDSNKDGKIDDSEMKQARDRASILVDEDLEEIYQAPATHVISHPTDGRPFLLSSIHPDKLLKKYKISLWIHTFIWIYLSILVLAMQVG